MVPKKSPPRRRYITIAAVIGAILLVSAAIFIAFAPDPFQKTVLTADSRTVSLDYLLKRTRMAGGDPALTLQQLAYEQVVEITASGNNITVSAADIDSRLMEQAYSDQGVSSTSVFQRWYADKLKTSQLSDREYREMVAAGIMANRLLEIMASDVPTYAEQAHVYAITVSTLDEAQKLKTRIDAGENFTALASSLALDATTRAQGGDLGWLPRGVTPYDDVIFSLTPGVVSTPVPVDPNNPGTSQYIVFKVTEKDPNRVIDPGPLQALKSRALYAYILKQIPQHIKFNYTPEDAAWINAELAKNS